MSKRKFTDFMNNLNKIDQKVPQQQKPVQNQKKKIKNTKKRPSQMQKERNQRIALTNLNQNLDLLYQQFKKKMEI